jgi:membrane protease YdiL (CAAX protease family)
MVSKLGADLSLQDHGLLWCAALANAICEEAVSRGFFFVALRDAGWTELQAHFFQALAFGIWHYHGIPSGIVGVILTFVYGLIMGLFCHLTGGLGLAIVVHTINDYYIFSTIARGMFHK